MIITGNTPFIATVHSCPAPMCLTCHGLQGACFGPPQLRTEKLDHCSSTTTTIEHSNQTSIAQCQQWASRPVPGVGSRSRVLTQDTRTPPTLPTRLDYSSNTQACRVVPRAKAESSIVATDAIGSLVEAVSQSWRSFSECRKSSK